jgi:hypothetical protein
MCLKTKPASHMRRNKYSERVRASPLMTTALVVLVIVFEIYIKVQSWWGPGGRGHNLYTPSYRGNDARGVAGYEASQLALKVYSTDDVSRDIRILMANGYLAYGELSFGVWTRDAPQKELLDFAQRTGCEVILLPSRSATHFNGAIPSTFLPGTLNQAQMDGLSLLVKSEGDSGDWESKIGFASDATPLRFYMNPHEYGAVYLAKIKTGLGIIVDAVDRGNPKSGAPGGLRVDVVIHGSLAENAGLLPGDQLISLNSIPIRSIQDFQDSAAKSLGHTVTAEFERDGVLIARVLAPKS